MSDIIKRLDIKAGVMEMGEKIAWGSDTALMREAARAIEAQNNRIKELEALVADCKEQEKVANEVAWELQQRVDKLGAVLQNVKESYALDNYVDVRAINEALGGES